MTRIGNILTHGTIAALISIGATVAMAPAASAHVICNRMGDCWSTHTRYAYPKELGVQFYTDRYNNRKWGAWRNRTWRAERHDQGYYRSGVWLTF